MSKATTPKPFAVTGAWFVAHDNIAPRELTLTIDRGDAVCYVVVPIDRLTEWIPKSERVKR